MLKINLSTVLEESEQEPEINPATAPKVMSSRRGRRRLVRGNAIDEEDEEAVRNQNGYKAFANKDDGNAADTDSLHKSSSSSAFGSLKTRFTTSVDNTLGDLPRGIIHKSEAEEKSEAMIKGGYSYDSTRRPGIGRAKILNRERRSVSYNFDTQTYENVTNAQKGEQDAWLYNCDSDEESEEYCKGFPTLVEDLFRRLNLNKYKETKAPNSQLDDILKRFVELFKTRHTDMSNRFNSEQTKLEKHRRPIIDFCANFNQSVQRTDLSQSQIFLDESTETHKSPKEFLEELEMHYLILSRSARRIGMMEVEKKMYKLIEVMVLYVHISEISLFNLNKEYIANRKLLEEHNINVKTEMSIEQLNNSLGTVHNFDSVNDEDLSETIDRCEDGKPKRILEGLLGPPDKQYPRNELVILGEEKSRKDIVVGYVVEWYEILLGELYWPWSKEQTWKGIKQGFSIILMLIGLFIIFVRMIAQDFSKLG